MSDSSQPADKAALRRQLRVQRKAVDAATRVAAGTALVRLALRHRLLQSGSRIGFYMPAKGEIDIGPLLDRARKMGVHCYLPVVPALGNRKLWFSRLGAQPEWFFNRYGIPEHCHLPAGRVRVQRLQRLFIPLLGFDARGYRLGMGGGYYDASLAYLKSRRHWKWPQVIGVAFSLQEVDRVPDDPWDIPLDGVLTECVYRRFRAPSVQGRAQPGPGGAQ